MEELSPTQDMADGTPGSSISGNVSLQGTQEGRGPPPLDVRQRYLVPAPGQRPPYNAGTVHAWLAVAEVLPTGRGRVEVKVGGGEGDHSGAVKPRECDVQTTRRRRTSIKADPYSIPSRHTVSNANAVQKGGRRRVVRKDAQTAVCQVGAASDVRRQRLRERNIVHANNSRRRRKMQEEDYKQEIAWLENDIGRIRAEVQSLEIDVGSLAYLLEKHPCDLPS